MIKNIIISAIAITSMIFTGCKSVPSVETMESTSKAIGYSAGLIASQTKMSETNRIVVIDIVNEVAKCVPQTNQTFESAWTPIAKEHVEKLVATGKVSKQEGDLILGAFDVAVKGIDYVFDVRYPKARQYENLVAAAVHGFTEGFLTTFKPTNTFAAPTVKYDEEAYKWLQSNK